MGHLPHQLSRRHLMRSLALSTLACGATALAGCSNTKLTLGQPRPYSPPPAGIDEIYRRQLIDHLSAFAQDAASYSFKVTAADEHAASTLADFPATYRTALSWQLHALRTGAEAEAAASATQSASSEAQQESGEAIASALSHLAKLRTLSARASLQTSASLARVCASSSAWAQWAGDATVRFATAAGINPPAFNALSSIEGNAEVPASDPPTAANPADLTEPLETAQTDEWFAAYALEVAAARVSGATRKAFLERVAQHRKNAEEYAQLAEGLGLASVPREAGYALPLPYDEQHINRYKVSTLSRTLTNAVALTGLAPFAQRHIPELIVLQAARGLAAYSSTLQALPGISTEQ